MDTPNFDQRNNSFKFFIPVSFWGDPHLLTLDGFQYTFNGLGDYVLVRTRDRSLHLHARTKRPTTTEGGLSNATVISALAFKTKDSEIDLVFRDDDCLVFVEVKARTEGGWTRPAAAVDQRKWSLLSKVAREYVRQLRDPNVKFRFDIVEVLLVDGEVNEVRHIPNAFPLTKAKRHA